MKFEVIVFSPAAGKILVEVYALVSVVYMFAGLLYLTCWSMPPTLFLTILFYIIALMYAGPLMEL